MLFIINDVPFENNLRGQHAHKRCHQYLIALNGEVEVTVDNGHLKQTFLLNDLHKGLHIPPLVWGTQTFKTKESILLVFASDNYSADDYISDYNEFKQMTNK